MDSNRSKELREENKKIRWLRWFIDLNIAQLYQDRTLDLERARALVWDVRRQVLSVFPDKAGEFDLILLPRLNRVLQERWGEGVDIFDQ